MEEKGLIYKQADSVDKRSVRIFLTELGLEKKEVSRQTVRHFNLKIREKIPQSQLDVFFKVSAQITGMIEGKTLFEEFVLKPLRTESSPS